MASTSDVIATAPAGDPELLELEMLDSIVGGVEYGGTNTCEPVDSSKGYGKWIDILSWNVPSFEQVTTESELRKK